MEQEKSMMMQRCDQLASTASELTITWEGGGDSGFFALNLDGKELKEYTDIDNRIIEFIEDYVGYGSFAGDFSTDGKLIYDRDAKAFRGEDNYGETEGVSTECNIELRLPGKIWFDRLNILIEVESCDSAVEVSIELIMRNGPHPPGFDELLPILERELSAKFSDVIDELESFDNMCVELVLPYPEFTACSDNIMFLIGHFDYSVYNTTCKELCIAFDDDLPAQLSFSDQLFGGQQHNLKHQP